MVSVSQNHGLRRKSFFFIGILYWVNNDVPVKMEMHSPELPPPPWANLICGIFDVGTPGGNPCKHGETQTGLF